MIRFGPAGWSYDDWAGIVYPDPKPPKFDPLVYLADYFDTIEVNSTFYRPATEKTGRSWVRRVENNPDFRFTAKLWRRFTHQREAAWTADEVAEVRAGMNPMLERDRLGALLLQFPWSFRRTPENREWLHDLVVAFEDFPLVVEVRHSSWNDPDFFETLADRAVGFVNIDQPLFRDSIKPSALATAPVAYIRVHGRNYKDWWREKAEPHERYNYLYSVEELEPWAKRAAELDEDPRTRDVYVVTNNHYKGQAPANALMLGSLVTGKKQPAPPPLFSAFQEELKAHAVPREGQERARNAAGTG